MSKAHQLPNGEYDYGKVRIEIDLNDLKSGIGFTNEDVGKCFSPNELVFLQQPMLWSALKQILISKFGSPIMIAGANQMPKQPRIQ